MESDWRFAQTSMASSLSYMLKNGEMADCCFLVGSTAEKQQKFSAHKFMLRAASPVFESMFFGKLAENSKDEAIEIVDIEKDAFDLLLKYIYCASFEFSSIDLAEKVYMAADKYLMEHLKNKCIVFLVSRMDVNNVLSVYEFAKAIEEPQLKQRAIELFRYPTCKIVHPDKFASLNISTLSTILDLSNLTVFDEKELFRLVEAYAFYRLREEGMSAKNPDTKSADAAEPLNAADPSNAAEPLNAPSVLMDQLRELIKKIRYLTLSAEMFAKGPAMSKLLSFEESSAIYECLLNSSKVNYIYPKGFTTERLSRCRRFCEGSSNCNRCRTTFDCNRIG